MKLLAILLIFFPSLAFAQGVYVKGYYKKNGTYVAPHYRSSPNSSVEDNWSTKGNYNPHTFEEGKKEESNSSNLGLTVPIVPPINYNKEPNLNSYSTKTTIDDVEVISGSLIQVKGKTYKLWGISDYNEGLYCGTTRCSYSAALYLKWAIDSAYNYYPPELTEPELVCITNKSDATKAICRINGVDLSALMLLSGYVYVNHDDTYNYDAEYRIGYNKIKSRNTGK